MIYVMSDIHGNKERFESVMKQIDLHPEDTLYVLGDVVDRNPYGIEILQTIMKMPNAKMLLGNHEYMMLNVLAGADCDDGDWKHSYWHDMRRLWFENGGRTTYQSIRLLTKEEIEEIKAYLKALPVNIDIEVNGQKYKLVHATDKNDFQESGLHDWYDNEIEYAVWKRWKPDEPTPTDYIMVCGHTPTIHYQEDNPLKIWHGNNMIDIDCGAGFPKDQGLSKIHLYGRLSCLRLDDMKEFYSEE